LNQYFSVNPFAICHPPCLSGEWWCQCSINRKRVKFNYQRIKKRFLIRW